MYAIRSVSFAIVVSCLVVLAIPAQAEWVTQTFDLRPGWNAVYLEVQPDNKTCDTVFAETPVSGVWAWNRRFSSVQYVRNPSELVPETPEWLAYFPPGSEREVLTSLFAVTAGQVYLIELAGTTNVQLNVTGRAVVPRKRWMADSFNLVGFSIDPNAPPTFADFFAPDTALNGQPIYRLTPAGEWRQVAVPETETLGSGEAFWIYCKGESSYAGPLSLKLDTTRMLEFGNILDEIVLGIKNESGVARTITINLRPADGTAAKTADGDLTLMYKTMFSWAPLPTPMTVTVEPESEIGVQLGVRRADMNAGTSDIVQYDGVLEVSDGAGTFYKIGVAAASAGSRAGLWVGTATVSMVSEAGIISDNVTPKPTGSNFEFRLIVHVDADGKAHLLRQCTLMQLAPTEVDGEPVESRYVILTDNTLIPEYSGVSIRDGEIVGRRISSPVFSFRAPVPMDGTLETRLRVESPIILDYEDPLNPFVHRYHPDHDNMDDRYEKLLSEGYESFTVKRTVELDFSEIDPGGFNTPDWGDDLVGGDYHETITGIHRENIHVKGQFRLNRILNVGVLNDGRE